MPGEGSNRKGEDPDGGDRGLGVKGAPRLTLAALVLVLTTGFAVGVSQGSPPDNPLKKAELSQKGRKLIVQIATGPAEPLRLTSLQRFPDTADRAAAYLCAEFDPPTDGPLRRICVGGEKETRKVVGLGLVNSSGVVTREEAVRATVTRPAPNRVTVSLLAGDVNLKPARYRWRAIYSDGGCAEDASVCGFSLPEDRLARYRVRPVDPVGCTGGNGQVVKSGPSGRRRVALTFDDGPSTYTGSVLKTLKRYRAKATFFVIGSSVRSNPGMARRIVAQGHEIANHSYSHPILPSRSELSSTNGAIRRATRFRPCTFRPPYGALDSRLAGDAKAERMKTILWNVDTLDWRQPGSGSIASSAGRASPGSIVLMHDGGGPRGQTVDALPSILSSLRSRGIKSVTVSKLLGSRVIYRPR